MADKPKYYITTAIAIHQASHISVTHTRSCWQTQLHVIREVRDMMCFSRQELTSMDRKLN